MDDEAQSEGSRIWCTGNDDGADASIRPRVRSAAAPAADQKKKRAIRSNKNPKNLSTL